MQPRCYMYLELGFERGEPPVSPLSAASLLSSVAASESPQRAHRCGRLPLALALGAASCLDLFYFPQHLCFLMEQRRLTWLYTSRPVAVLTSPGSLRSLGAAHRRQCSVSRPSNSAATVVPERLQHALQVCGQSPLSVCTTQGTWKLGGSAGPPGL